MKFKCAMLLAAAFPATAFAAGGPTALHVTIKGLDEQGRLTPRHAFCQPDLVAGVSDGGNVSPELAWGAGPEGTKSFVVIMHDPDVPQKFDDANKEGRIIMKSAPRRDFVHWVLVDIPAATTRLPEGADSDRKDAGGKRTQNTRYGVRGINDFGKKKDSLFFGYDGPCPPWNDDLWHNYRFSVYALDIPSLNLGGAFTGRDVMRAMEGHVLARGQVVGRFSNNPKAVLPPVVEAEASAPVEPEAPVVETAVQPVTVQEPQEPAAPAMPMPEVAAPVAPETPAQPGTEAPPAEAEPAAGAPADTANPPAEEPQKAPPAKEKI